MNETHITMVGNAVEDPVLRFGKNGAQFVTFRLASNVRRRDPHTGLYVDSGTNFVTVLAFRQLAANIAESVHKGQPVVVTGRLRVTQWSTGERSGTSVEVDATSVGHDLSRGTAKFIRVKSGHVGEGSFPADVPGASLRVAGAGDAGDAGSAEFGAAGSSLGPVESPAYEEFEEAPLPAYDGPLPPYEDERDELYGGGRERMGA